MRFFSLIKEIPVIYTFRFFHSVLFFTQLPCRLAVFVPQAIPLLNRRFDFDILKTGKGAIPLLPYTIKEIQQRVTPVAQKYQLAAVYLFGSYARGEATAESDVDLLIDLTGSVIHGLNYVSLYYDLQDALQTSVDIVTADTLDYPTDRRSEIHFNETVRNERKLIYEAA